MGLLGINTLIQAGYIPEFEPETWVRFPATTTFFLPQCKQPGLEDKYLSTSHEMPLSEIMDIRRYFLYIWNNCFRILTSRNVWLALSKAPFIFLPQATSVVADLPRL